MLNYLKTFSLLLLSLNPLFTLHANTYECSEESNITLTQEDYALYYSPPSWQMQLIHQSAHLAFPDTITTSLNQNKIILTIIAERKDIGAIETYIIKPKIKSNEHTLLYIHGGAFIKAITNYHIEMLVDLANRLGNEIYVPLYTLADNKSYPSQIDEVFDIYKYMKNQFGAENIVVMGDSAGGTLAFNLLNRVNKSFLEQPSKLIVLSPWMNLSLDNPLIPYYDKKDLILSKIFLETSAKKYLAERYTAENLASPDVSPIQMNTLSELPPTLYIGGNADLFYPDSILFRDRALEQGMDLTFITVNGGFHVFPISPALFVPESNIAREQMVFFINCR